MTRLVPKSWINKPKVMPKFSTKNIDSALQPTTLIFLTIPEFFYHNFKNWKFYTQLLVKLVFLLQMNC